MADTEDLDHDHQFTATVWYLERLDLYKDEKPYMITFDPTGFGGQKTNHKYSQHEVLMTDVRGREGDFTLAKQGFQFLKWSTALVFQDFDDENVIRERYYPEIVEQVQNVFPDAVEVSVLTHLLRKRQDFSKDLTPSEAQKLGPIFYAHGDFTPEGARASLEESFFKDHEHLRGKEVQIINVWRVLKGPNRDHPLALCDYTTVCPEDDIEFNDVIHRNHIGESIRAYYNPHHRWYFLGDQMVDEVVLFRNCDSGCKDSPVALHLAFKDPRQTSQLPARESIEIRLAIFS